MLTWLNQRTTGEHFAILRDYEPRINDYWTTVALWDVRVIRSLLPLDMPLIFISPIIVDES